MTTQLGSTPGDDSVVPPPPHGPVALSRCPVPGQIAFLPATAEPEVAPVVDPREAEEELTFATRVAWRNAATCGGRRPWSTLVVRDQRHLASGAQIAEDCVRHLHQALNDGAILPTISVYERPPPAPRARACGTRS